MSLDEAHRLALKILKEVMEEKVDENNVQLAQVTTTEGGKEAKFEILSAEATKELIAQM